MAENYVREEAISNFFIYLRLIVSLWDLENLISEYLYTATESRVTNFHDDFDVD